MRLPEFMSVHMESTLQDFEDFARINTAMGESMDVEALRDLAEEVLETIIIDLGEPQSARAQERKSEGKASPAENASDTAARMYGSERAEAAFTPEDIVAEFHALRASVLRQWGKSEDRKHDAEDDEDQSRFHEAIDEALAQSVKGYASELEEHQKAREQLEIAQGISQARSVFLQIVSHELRTPLHAFSGYRSLLEKGVYGPVTESQRAVLGRMKAAIEHLSGIIDGILELQPNGETTPLTVEECTVAEVLEGLESLVTPMAKSHGVEFDMSLAGAGEPFLADASKLRQILLNLITNALSYTPEGGRVWLDYQETSDEACFRVHDTGPGIPEDKLEAVFDPFTQLDMSLTREHDGIGLGLAISRQLADGMGGRITVTSEVGTGSVFTVALRRAGS
ncbi:MAG: HAMP domain-containing sensor histidine kinase [Gemmatimonadota bacterium]